MHDLAPGWPTAQKYAAHLQRMSIPLSILFCPTRRTAVAYPWNQWEQRRQGAGGQRRHADELGRTDYAIHGGIYRNPGYPA